MIDTYEDAADDENDHNNYCDDDDDNDHNNYDDEL